MNELQKLSKARQELEKAETLDEIQDFQAKAEALRKYAKQSGMKLVEQNDIALLRIRAEWLGGGIVDEMQRAQGFRTDLTSASDWPKSFAQQVKAIPMALSTAKNWSLEYSLPWEDIETYAAEIREVKELTSADIISMAKELRRNNMPVETFESKYPPLITLISYDEFLSGFDDQSIDLLLTDPPYMTDVDDIYEFAHWVDLALPKIKPTGRAYICIGAYPQEIEAYLQILNKQQDFTLANILVWTYRNTLGPQPKMTYMLNWQAILYLHGKSAPQLNCPLMTEQFAVQDINAPDGRTGIRYHAWQKPDELGERLIKHSTNVDDLVVDCFAGTGSFVIAAAKLGRKVEGCEISPEMLDIAQQRGCIINAV